MAITQHNYLHHEMQDTDDEHDHEDQHYPGAESSESFSITWWRKLSVFTVLTMNVAILSMPLVILLLSFLWRAPNNGENSPVWRQFVLYGWLLKAITASALVIRTATSMTAVTATSMLACILLERSGVALKASAPISVIRFINSGPLGLLMEMGGTFKHARLCSLAILLLVCTTLLLQFTSTVLVADIGIGTLTIPSWQNTTATGLAFSNGNLTASRHTQTQTYWIHNVQTFPTFAECREQDPNRSVSDAVRDTGTTLRAFLPLAQATARTSTKQFQGTATVMDSRTVCIRPKSNTEMVVAITEEWGWLLGAQLIPEIAPPGLILSDKPAVIMDWLQNSPIMANTNGSQTSASRTLLAWAQVVPNAHDAGEWNIVQKLMFHGPVLISALDPRYPDISTGDTTRYKLVRPTLGMGDDEDNELLAYPENSTIPLMTGRSYVVLNITADVNQLTPLIDAKHTRANGTIFSPEQDLNKLVITPRNEWLEFTIPRVPNFHLSVSLCFDSYATADLFVNATQDHMVDEPILGGFNASSQSFDTSEVLCQLGIDVSTRRKDYIVDKTDSNCTDRGIMTLHSTPQQFRDQIKGWFNNKSQTSELGTFPFPTQNFVTQDLWSPFTSGVLMCSGCGITYKGKSYINFQYPGLLQRGIFQDAIMQTGNVALAFQAYYTNMARIAYYDTLAFFDIADNPTISRFQRAQFPQSSRGLTAVIVVLTVHLIIVVAVTIVFFNTTQFSFVGGNAWQSLAQAFSRETKDIMVGATVMQDKQVEKQIKKMSGVHGERKFVSLGILEDSSQRRIGLGKTLSAEEKHS